MSKSKSLNSLPEFQQEIELIEKQLKMGHANLLSLLDFQTETKSCSKGQSNFTVTKFYEFSNHSLEREIKVRQNEQREFSAEEIKVLIVDLLSGLQYATENGIKIADPNPRNVIFRKQQVHCSKLIPVFNEKYDHTYEKPRKSKQIFYSSKCLKQLVNNQKVEPNLEDNLFAVGLIILHLGLLSPIDEIYDQRNLSVDEDQLCKLIIRFIKKYQLHQSLCNMVKKLLFTKNLQIKELVLDLQKMIRKQSIDSDSSDDDITPVGNKRFDFNQMSKSTKDSHSQSNLPSGSKVTQIMHPPSDFVANSSAKFSNQSNSFQQNYFSLLIKDSNQQKKPQPQFPMQRLEQ